MMSPMRRYCKISFPVEKDLFCVFFSVFGYFFRLIYTELERTYEIRILESSFDECLSNERQ